MNKMADKLRRQKVPETGSLDGFANSRHKRAQDDARATDPYYFVRHHSGLANKARPGRSSFIHITLCR
jgi:hypothetical protein